MNKNLFFKIKFILVASFFFSTFSCIVFLNISWATTYKMQYKFQPMDPSVNTVWMPVPRYWDGQGMKKIEGVSISPKPTSHYQESNGTELAYWEAGDFNVDKTFTIDFIAKIEPVKHDINENTIWPNYDTNSALYTTYTSPNVWTQSDDQEIITKATEIVGAETSPYKKAKLIHAWVSDWNNISGPPPTVPDGSGEKDAKSVLQRKWGGCGGKATLFVALTKAVGIPARTVAGYHPSPYQNVSFSPGTAFWTGYQDNNVLKVGTHVWAEFHLPGYGWVQCDPTQSTMFGEIPQERLVLSKGDNIKVGNGFTAGTLTCDINGIKAWVHFPLTPHNGAWLVNLITDILNVDTPIQIEQNFDFTIPRAVYGTMNLQINFKYFGDQAGTSLWYLDNYSTTTSSSTPITISSTDLSFKVMSSTFTSNSGDINLWLEFNYFGNQNGKMLWELLKYGLN